MKDHHFDTILNYLIFKWRTAQISDDEMLLELKQEIFQNKYKGPGLQGVIILAMGEKEEGLKILKEYLKENEQDEELSNMKLERFKDEIRELFEQIEEDKESFT